jgi:hypothetical protein
MFLMKGFRNDIFIEIEGEFYNIFCFTFQRFISELNISMNDEDYYVPEMNVIILNDIDKMSIEKGIRRIGKGTLLTMKACYHDTDNIYLNLSNVEKEIISKTNGTLFIQKKDLILFAMIND